MTIRILIPLLGLSVALCQEAPQGGGGEQGGAPGGGGGGNAGGNTGGGFPGGGANQGNAPGRGQTQDPRQQQDPFGRGQQQQQRFPDMQRPIFLSGKVVTEEGVPPPDSVVIERICNGQIRPEAYTDSKGRFSFQLGQNQGMMADASVSAAGDGFGGIGGSQQNNSPFGGMNSRGVTERDLMGCELRAALPGYRSEVVNLSGRRFMDNPDVGTIVIRRLAGVEGSTISMTTLQAPKDAKKAFDKSKEHVKKQKWDQAQKELEKAVGLYPKYAVAWHMLGQIHQQSNRIDEAKSAYAKSVEADNKYVSPQLQLAVLAAGENKWDEVADLSSRVTRLNPMDFPIAHFYNAVANYNLQKFDEAEASAREVVKLDTQHKIPKAQHILGALLAMKNDYAGAAENMRGYLQFAPQAQDADMVKKQLSEIEQRLGTTEVGQKQE